MQLWDKKGKRWVRRGALGCLGAGAASSFPASFRIFLFPHTNPPVTLVVKRKDPFKIYHSIKWTRIPLAGGVDNPFPTLKERAQHSTMWMMKRFRLKLCRGRGELAGKKGEQVEKIEKIGEGREFFALGTLSL